MNLLINNKLSIPYREFKWRFSRSSGSGGQNLNKTDSKVEIIFCIEKSKFLNNFQKIQIRKNIDIKLISDCISIVVQEQRTQFQNRQIALKKMATLLNDALNKRKIYRIKTKPTKLSQIKRLEQKKRRGELKRNRSFNDSC